MGGGVCLEKLGWFPKFYPVFSSEVSPYWHCTVIQVGYFNLTKWLSNFWHTSKFWSSPQNKLMFIWSNWICFHRTKYKCNDGAGLSSMGGDPTPSRGCPPPWGPAPPPSPKFWVPPHGDIGPPLDLKGGMGDDHNSVCRNCAAASTRVLLPATSIWDKRSE